MTAVDPIRIRLRYADLDVFVRKFAPNVTRGGVFLATRNLRPVGSIILLRSRSPTAWWRWAVRQSDLGAKSTPPSRRPYGMGVQSTSVDGASRAVLAVLKAKAFRAGRAPAGPHASIGHAVVAGGERNGRIATMPAVDTNVDLVAELGLSEDAIRASSAEAG